MCYEPWTVQRGCSDKRTVCRAGIQRGGISVGMQEFFRCGGDSSRRSMALDWGITLQCDTTGKEDARIRVDVTKEQWQQYQKHISGNKIWIGIDEKDVMLLK